MIQHVPARSRYLADHGWLKTYHLFSFADYYDPDNMNFGNLRVFNDDFIRAKSGFGAHSHRDMEIVTIMLSGTLTHEDSMGNKKEIRAGEVQRMSAGTGVTHSEYNHGSEDVHLYQIWIQPRQLGLRPEYDQMTFDVSDNNKIIPLVSDHDQAGTLGIHADASVSLLNLEPNHEMTFQLSKERGLFLYLTKGECLLNGQALKTHDQARISEVDSVHLKGVKGAQLVMIEVGL